MFAARRAREFVGGFFVEIDQPEFDFTVNPTSGLVEVTPPDGFTGTLLLEAQAGAAGTTIETTDSIVDRQLISIEVV